MGTKQATLLPPIPKAPAGVKYALTVPQSVLFAELSLQGNKREFFRAAMQIDYELGYVIKDADGAISWNYDNDEVFYRAFVDNDDPHVAVRRFTTVMGTTARKLMRRSELGFGVFRRPANAEDIIEDLSDYWRVYKLHMTCLFTFWNVEQILVEVMTEQLKKEGLYSNTDDVAQFIRPAETNQFARERRSFERLVWRFSDGSNKPSSQLLAALRHHALTFNFLLNPSFSPASDNQDDHALLERVAETRQALAQQTKPDGTNEEIALLNDLPTTIKHLALTARDLTFWKNERIDVMSLADALIAPLYDETAKMLGLSPADLFAMTSGEIQQSLLRGKVVVDGATLEPDKIPQSPS